MLFRIFPHLFCVLLGDGGLLPRPCHPERSEGSFTSAAALLRSRRQAGAQRKNAMQTVPSAAWRFPVFRLPEKSRIFDASLSRFAARRGSFTESSYSDSRARIRSARRFPKARSRSQARTLAPRATKARVRALRRSWQADRGTG